MNIWDKKFYGKEEEFRKEIFRIPHHIFDEMELKTLFSHFESLDIHHTGEDKIQTPSPHYTMLAKLKKKS